MNFDFSKLTTSVQYLLVGIAVIMPIFYFDLFLYHKTFFNSNPTYLTVVASYCLSIGWLIFGMIIGLVFLLFVVGYDNVPVETVVGYGNVSALFMLILANLDVFFQDERSSLNRFFFDLLISYILTLLIVCRKAYKKRKQLKKVGQMEIDFNQ